MIPESYLMIPDAGLWILDFKKNYYIHIEHPVSSIALPYSIGYWYHQFVVLK